MNATASLARSIARHARGARTTTAVPGLALMRAEAVTRPVEVVYAPMVCVVAQGAKRIHVGRETIDYGPGRTLVSSLHLPVRGEVVEATAARPYLALSLALDPALVAEVQLGMPPAASARAPVRALAVAPMDDALCDAFVRLLGLLDRPADVASLAPLTMREIVYRMLTGEQAPLLRRLALRRGRTPPVVRAIDWLRRNYRRPFDMGELERIANMSAPSLHRHFKAITATSPLQYQKRMRLQEARRLLVSGRQDAASVGFAVGYASPSQFSREYSRLFGAPPREDAKRLLDDPAWRID